MAEQNSPINVTDSSSPGTPGSGCATGKAGKKKRHNKKYQPPEHLVKEPVQQVVMNRNQVDTNSATSGCYAENKSCTDAINSVQTSDGEMPNIGKLKLSDNPTPGGQGVKSESRVETQPTCITQKVDSGSHAEQRHSSGKKRNELTNNDSRGQHTSESALSNIDADSVSTKGKTGGVSNQLARPITNIKDTEHETNAHHVCTDIKKPDMHPVGTDIDKKEAHPSGTNVAISEQALGDAVQKSKKQLSMERRAIQEAQRAAKAAGLKTKPVAKEGKQAPPQGKEAQPGKQIAAGQKEAVKQIVSKEQCMQSSQGMTNEKKVAPSGGDLRRQERSSSGSLVDGVGKVRVSGIVQADDERTVKRTVKKLERQNVPNRMTERQRKVGLFSHLHQYERDVPLTKDIHFAAGSIHPAIIRLGLQYAEGVVCGSNARCVALLLAMKKVITDYRTPPNTELARDLEMHIRPSISFLSQCRPLSVSMGNAIRHLKHHISRTPSQCPDEEAKTRLCEEIDKFLKERIVLAAKAISESACKKINDGDVILVYSCSSLIRMVLCTAYDNGKKFSVIVVDGRPKNEGREMLRRLVHHGIRCSYVLINSVSYVMKEVTQVLLGAHALLANGYVMSRVGTSQVALIATAYNVPVIVCCETYKFCERVQTDSFVLNELGDPDDLVTTDGKNRGLLTSWHDVARLGILNLLYDVTPPQLITMVITDITDFGLVPCTSVPVVLRVKSADT